MFEDSQQAVLSQVPQSRNSPCEITLDDDARECKCTCLCAVGVLPKRTRCSCRQSISLNRVDETVDTLKENTSIRREGICYVTEISEDSSSKRDASHETDYISIALMCWYLAPPTVLDPKPVSLVCAQSRPENRSPARHIRQLGGCRMEPVPSET